MYKLHDSWKNIFRSRGLHAWLEQVDPPATWAAITDAVEFLGEEQLGKKLREKYVVNSLRN